jgi:hypothetical protein
MLDVNNSLGCEPDRFPAGRRTAAIGATLSFRGGIRRGPQSTEAV